MNEELDVPELDSFIALMDTMTRPELLDTLVEVHRTRPKIAAVVYDVVISDLNAVDMEQVTVKVFEKLEQMPLDKLLSYPRGTSWDYVDRSEAAYDIIFSTLKPYIRKLKLLLRLEHESTARIYVQGILSGIYRYHTVSEQEFKNYLNGHLIEEFHYIIDEYKQRSDNDDETDKLLEFVSESFAEWVS